MKKQITALLLTAAVLFSLTLPAFAAETGLPADVDPGQWYAEAVKNVMDRGIMNGTGTGFVPLGTITRGTVVQTLYNLEGRPEVNNKMATFPDVQGEWYEDAVRWAEQAGITSGTGVGFVGEGNVTRTELVVFLYRYGEYKGHTAVANEINLLDYADGELLESWSIPAFQWAVGNGIISGKSGNRLAPGDSAIRAELAKILTGYTDLFPLSPAGGEEKPAPAYEGREDYPSDAAYANFRPVTVGNIAPNMLYRSSSPIDPNQGDRRFAADALVKEAGVATVVNTSDCRFKFRGFEGFDDTHYATLHHVALNMGRDYPSDAFLEDMYNGLDFISEFTGPYLIHGTEGVERTGYVCMVLEALMGATKEELLADFLRSYEEYRLVEPNTAPWEAAREQGISNLLTFTGAADEAALDQTDLAAATRTYLLEKVGLSEAQIDLIVAHLSGK